MSVQHQVSDELLLDYASGNLSEGWSLAISTHLALCPQARRRLQEMEGAAGALFDKISANQNVSDGDWEKMKAKLSGAEPPKRSYSTPVQAEGVIPEPLRSYLGGDVSSLKWKALGRGAYQIRINTNDPRRRFVCCEFRQASLFPSTHDGRELTLVLAGSFHDGEDLFARGDLEEADGSLLHTPTATEGEDCICLAVTEAPLKFSSWIVRMIQPILKI